MISRKVINKFIRLISKAINTLVSNGGTLSQLIVRGGVWVFLTYSAQQILAFIRYIILARLLSPDDFGLMGIVSLSITAVMIFTETGVWAALIQKTELDRGILNTAWIISVFRGLSLGLFLFVISPLVSVFFNSDMLLPLLRVMSLIFIIDGFDSLGIVLLQRNLEFKKLTTLNVSVELIKLITVILIGFVFKSVWIIVIGELVGSVSTLILSYIIHDFRPQPQFNLTHAKQLLNFGKYITAAGIVTYLTTQGDDAYVGKTLGTSSLGFYTMAYKLSNMPATSISHVINKITFPAFSMIQNDVSRLKFMYLKTLRITSTISMPFAGGMFCLAAYFIPVLIGSKWTPIIPSFMVLCLFGLERSIGSIAGPVILALGKPKISFLLNMLKLIAMGVSIIPLTIHYGFLGTSISVTFSAIIVECGVLPVVAHLLNISIWEILRQLRPSFLATLFMSVMILVIRQAFDLPVNLASMIGLIVVGCFSYGIFILKTESDLVQNILIKIQASTRYSD